MTRFLYITHNCDGNVLARNRQIFGERNSSGISPRFLETPPYLHQMIKDIAKFR